MEVHSLAGFSKGWFIGAFAPTLLDTGQFEIATKRYRAGEEEARHLHKVATEYTLVVSGRVKMNGVTYGSDDIVVIFPGEATDFRALEDTVTVVVKVPCVAGDKYIVGES